MEVWWNLKFHLTEGNELFTRNDYTCFSCLQNISIFRSLSLLSRGDILCSMHISVLFTVLGNSFSFRLLLEQFLFAVMPGCFDKSILAKQESLFLRVCAMRCHLSHYIPIVYPRLFLFVSVSEEKNVEWLRLSMAVIFSVKVWRVEDVLYSKFALRIKEE